MEILRIVTVQEEYCDYLRKYDALVPYNYEKKNNRPYIGVLFEVNKCKYFAPLSSPKEKHKKMKNSLDFYKLENSYYDRKLKKHMYQLIGAINFNNMIPLTEKNYALVDLDRKCETKIEEKYINLLKLDYRVINKNIYEISKKAKDLYHLYKDGKLDNKIMKRCCNFPLLEEKCKEYEKEG